MVVAVRPLLPTPAAVIFDFNGTISDDEPLLARLFVQIFAEAGIEVTERLYFDEFAGYSDPEIVHQVLGRLGRSDPALESALLDRRTVLYLDAVTREPPVPPEAAGFVRQVAERVPVAIASGAARREIEAVLVAAGLRELFPVLVATEDVERSKPDPEGYVQALELLSAHSGHALDPARVLVFEDSTMGIEAAHAAGMACVAVEGTATPEQLAAADRVVSRLDWSIPLVEGWG